MRDVRSAVKTSNWFAYTLLVESIDSLLLSMYRMFDATSILQLLLTSIMPRQMCC